MTLDDLIAARLLHKSDPELKDRLIELLAQLESRPQRGGVGFRTLLSELVREQAIPRERASYVYDQVERFHRGRALGVYVQLLVQEGGLPREQVEARVQALGEGCDGARLERALGEAGVLPSQTLARLRYMAKLALDRDAAEQLAAFQSRRKAESARTMVAGEGYSGDALDTGVAGEKLPSGVYRDELVLPGAAEATGILDRAALGLALVAPRFPVPEWVDTSDELTGRMVGSFRILGLVGQGAMAKVYLADRPDLEEPVALKLLPAGSSKERQARFKREILANGFFSHENVIDVYDAGVTERGHHYLAMEFFDGTDLEEVLEAEGTLSLLQSLELIVQVLDALEVAHQAGIVHRDIKPGNIMVDLAGTRAKLTDFGIALIKDLGDFKGKVFESDDGGITGTPEYLSPEQAFRDPLGPPSDLYSLGFVLYRMLAGRLPFVAETIPGWINSHIADDPARLDAVAPDRDWPPRLLRLFDHLFVKDPKQRLGRAADFRGELLAVLEEVGGGRNTRAFSRIRGGF
ncbi:MAG: serine/threonine-protein kinase [Planctomycetota bacterium]